MSEPSFGEQREPTLSTAVEMQLTDASARLAEPTVPARGWRLATRPAVCRAFFTKA